MPDGRRKRRFSTNTARRRWYAEHRSRRFCRRFGWISRTWMPGHRGHLPARCDEPICTG